jgi:hypothetical protein
MKIKVQMWLKHNFKYKNFKKFGNSFFSENGSIVIEYSLLFYKFSHLGKISHPKQNTGLQTAGQGEPAAHMLIPSPLWARPNEAQKMLDLNLETLM